ncbi:unnamed protein product [Trichobilharzia szidati]|nr:unnamed protein product [Trichobilharzia szidati]
MFNSIYIYISMITLLVFATMNEGESTELEDIKNAISDARKKSYKLADLIKNGEAAIKQLKNKIILETGGKDNSTIENYISCLRKHYEAFFRYELFEIIKKQPKEPIWSEEYSLRECFEKEANAHEAEWISVSKAGDCEHYKPSGNKEDLQELKRLLMLSYQNRMLYGEKILFMKTEQFVSEVHAGFGERKRRRM